MMLVLLRDVSDTVVIGKAGDVLKGPVVVTVVALRSNGARLGIDAQRDIAVHRGEVQAAIEAANTTPGGSGNKTGDPSSGT